MTDWTVGWAKWGWAILIGAMLVFELYTLWWNKRNKGKRANLTAYVSAFFQRGDRRLKYKAGPAVLVVVFVYFLGHFMDWWR